MNRVETTLKELDGAVTNLWDMYNILHQLTEEYFDCDNDDIKILTEFNYYSGLCNKLGSGIVDITSRLNKAIVAAKAV